MQLHLADGCVDFSRIGRGSSTPTTYSLTSSPRLFLIRSLIHYYLTVCPVFFIAFCLSPSSFVSLSLLQNFMVDPHTMLEKHYIDNIAGQFDPYYVNASKRSKTLVKNKTYVIIDYRNS